MNREELGAFVDGLGEKPFRAKQLFEWIHNKKASSFDEMTNLSKTLREKLGREAFFYTPGIVTVQQSKDGTRKYLFRLHDGQCVESVLMRYHHGNSVCISSQAGCAMGCAFCASGIGGLVRSLSAGEMLDQIYRIGDETGERIANVVVMGTGEPLTNLDSLLRMIELLNDEGGQNLSQRSITVSTCGIVPAMRRLAREKLAITLAVSLHSAIQEKRERIMPVAKTYSLDELFDACGEYRQITGRRLTFEYSLIAGVNDGDEDVRALILRLKNTDAHVNLIAVNAVTESEFKAPSKERVRKFQKKLEKNGINSTIRRECGADIDGACGQLRRSAYERYIDQ